MFFQTLENDRPADSKIHRQTPFSRNDREKYIFQALEKVGGKVSRFGKRNCQIIGLTILTT